MVRVAERADLQPLLQERQIIQNTRTALQGKNAQSLPPLRFAGVILDGGLVGCDTNETTVGAGANYLGVGANVQYRQDIITVALRAVSVQTRPRSGFGDDDQDRLLSQCQRDRFLFAAVDQLTG